MDAKISAPSLDRLVESGSLLVLSDRAAAGLDGGALATYLEPGSAITVLSS